MKKQYLDLMEKVLSAYSDDDISNYLCETETNGMTEHGFPRLTSNIGILIANGRRCYLKNTFVKMMNLCCEEFLKPAKPGRGSDFAVKEIIFCVMELEKSKAVSQDLIDKWKDLLSKIDNAECYNVYAKSKKEYCGNWALFTAVSEFMREHIGIADTKEFVDTQIATQLKRLDCNMMFRDNNFKQNPHPFTYDVVPRGLFSVLMHFGYNGEYAEEIDESLKTAGLLTLKMQSVSGELPFGGRSNQFLHNESNVALILEYEANRYYKEGNIELAGKFKAGAEKALDSISKWLNRDTITHVKNNYPTDSKIGCEDYAYFNKYMITTASFLYVAYMFCNDDIIPVKTQEDATSFSLSKSFCKTFLKNGNWFVEIDDNADTHYDANGIGRVHFKNAPSAICISAPGTATPNFNSPLEENVDFSIVPGVSVDGETVFAVRDNAEYVLKDLKSYSQFASATYECTFLNWQKVIFSCEIDEKCAKIGVYSNDEVALMLPIFHYDGKTYTEIKKDKNTIEVYYDGYVCRYTATSEIEDMNKTAFNRNGEYKIFCVKDSESISVKIEIKPN